jgi:glycosyltransferase involved in cell wall biosynthesis
MIKKVLRKTSSLLYKAHVFINGLSKERPSFVPYQLSSQPSKSSIKIIHANGNFIIGGTSQLIVDIIEHTSEKYSHKIIVPELPDPLPYQPLAIYSFPYGQMQELYDFLKVENPDFVHIHYWIRHEHRYKNFAIWYQTVFKICEELKIDVIQNINVPTAPFFNSSVVHNVFVSDYVKNEFNNSAVSSSVIYPGSDFSHFKNEDLNSLPNNIGMVYRLDRDKLNPEAIEVFITVVKRNPDIQCYIIGGGHYFEYYKKRVAEEKLSNNFVFTGFVSYKSLPGLYKKMCVFVAPVHDESFGQVTPFAMSMGLAVAGYDIGALSEIMGYKNTLAEYGQVDKLADIIIDLIESPEKRISIGEANKERAHKHFSVESMVEQYIELYDKYLSKGG